MKIAIRVIPNAKKERIIEMDGSYRVYINAPAIDGKANKRLIEVMAKHFNTKKSNIKILRGEKSRNKIIEVIK